MAQQQRTFNLSSDSMVILSPGGTSLGAGADHHLCVGETNGYTLRSLLKFALDFDGMYEIVEAELEIWNSSTHYHGTKTSDNMHIARCTSSWSAGSAKSSSEGGSGWSGSNAVEWSNQPSVTSDDLRTLGGSSSHNSKRSQTITGIVRKWAPASAGGENKANYGIRLKQVSESSGNYGEFVSEEGSGSTARIIVTYEDSPPTPVDPTPSISSPTENGLARIHNMTDLTGTSFQAKPELRFVYTGERPMVSYQVQLYSDAGGSTQVHDTGTVTHPAVNGATVTAPLTYVATDGTDLWAKVTVTDTAPLTGVSSLRRFRVRWGHAIVARNVGAGASGIAVALTPATPAANTQRQVFYRIADAGTNPTTWSYWVSSLGSLPTPTVAMPWLQVLVRMSSDLAGTNPALDKAVFSYQAAGGVPFPDKWVVAKGSGAAGLDANIRRYGSKSLKLEAVTGTGGYVSIYPTTAIAGDPDVPVTPNTDYVYTVEVRTDDLPLPTGNTLFLRVDEGNDGPLIATVPLDDEDGATPGTYDIDGIPLYPEGWKRLRLAFRTPAGVNRIRPLLMMADNAGASTFWVDGAMLTEGTVAPPWSQGTVGASGTLSASGMQLDASQGAIVRLRGSDGGVRDVVELGAAGLTFGGDVEVSSPAAGVLAVNGNPLERYVSLGVAAVYTGSVSASDGSLQTLEVTEVPTSGVTGIALWVAVSSDAVAASNALMVYDWSASGTGSVNAIGGVWGSGVANYGNSSWARVVPGGTNGRQIKYWRSRGAGTLTWHIRVVGYWTTE